MSAPRTVLAGGLLAALLAAAPHADAAEALRLHVWVRAFIPSVHPQLPDYIRRTQKGTWVIEAPIAPPASDGTARVGPVVRDGFDYRVRVSAGSPNPFYTVGGTSIAPDIDYDIAITYNRLYRTLRFEGTAGAFPSLEAYYAVGAGPAVAALQLPPEGDATALSLFDFGFGLNMRKFNPLLPVRPR